MISRISTIFWMILIVAAALGLYVVKYQVQGVQEELAKQEAILKEERESLHVLEAEWAFLSRPQRLQELTTKHLALAPSLSKQISAIDSLPFQATLSAANEAPQPQGEEPESPAGIIPAQVTVHGR